MHNMLPNHVFTRMLEAFVVPYDCFNFVCLSNMLFLLDFYLASYYLF